MDPLSNFHHAAALHLASISPALAALHAHKAQGQSRQNLSPLHCSRCGHLAVSTRISSASRTRRTCQKGKTMLHKAKQNHPPLTSAFLIRSCAICGNLDSRRLEGNGQAPRTSADRAKVLPNVEGDASSITTIPNNSSKKPSFDIALGGQKNSRPHYGEESEAVMPLSNKKRASSPTQPGSSLSSEKSSAKRAKKKSALQEMLARSKEQSANRMKDTKPEGGNLSAFLSGL